MARERRRRQGWFRLPWLAASVLGLAAGPSAGAERVFADAGCRLASGPVGIVTSVDADGTLHFADGLPIRLAGLEFPDPASPAAAALAAALADLTLGRVVELRYGAVRTDRYARATAQIFVPDPGEPLWVQAALLERGLAFVSGFADDRVCLAALLASERGARAAGAGIWSSERPFAADEPSLRLADALYVLVEGTVVSVGRTDSTAYLNFGRDWSTDFTVTITARNARAFESDGGALDALAGHRVRIRGWLTQRDGPLIVVDHPEQIEILDAADEVPRAP